MRTWHRTTQDVRCGLCNHAIPRGEPVLVLRIANIRRLIVRCPACAGYPAPDDLPPLAEPLPIPVTPLVHIPTGVNTLPYDFKSAASGEREPGEEG